MKMATNTVENVEVLKGLFRDANIYNLVSAVRGNDYGLSHIKYLFTSRIRYFLNVDKTYTSVREDEYISFFEYQDIFNDIEYAKSIHMNKHYFLHVRVALRILTELKLISKDESENLTMLASEIEDYINGVGDIELINQRLSKLVR